MKFNIKSNFSCFIISVFSFLAFLTSVIIQTHYRLNPCSICILARYIIIFISFINLGLCFSFSKTKLIALHLISAVLITIGLFYSLRHIYLVYQKIDNCSIDKLQIFLNDIPIAKEFPLLFQATGSCLDSNFLFFGVPFTSLTFIFYITILSLSLLPLFEKK